MNKNIKHENIEPDINFNKRQFWTYKRLFERNRNKSNIINSNQNIINKTKKRIFHLINNKIATDNELVKRLDTLYIPNNYKDIVVAKSINNKIQAIGTDNRGRRQYVYNLKFTKKRNDRKYDFIIGLGNKIIQIENDNISSLNTLASKPYNMWKLPDDYIPIIIYMLRTYHFRIGNEKYTNDNNSYGITTLKKEHIIFTNKHKLLIKFIGKKGILNVFNDNNPNPTIITILKTLLLNASNDGFLFKYNNDGTNNFITPDYIYEFFQNKYNEYITPKMFRTWYGNYHMLSHLRNIFNKGNILKPHMYKREISNIIKNCSTHVSSKLNNTPIVSKQSYIDNKILDLIKQNPYLFASKIPDNHDEQHKFLYKIIMKLRHI